jgi:hypothetical protein
MSEFSDRLVLQLSDPAQLVQLLAPAADTAHTRLRTLLDAAFTMDFATLHDIRDIQVLSTEFERPIFPLKRVTGTWTQTTPAYERTDVRYEGPDFQAPVWVDIAAAVALTLVLEVDLGAVASIMTREIANFNSLDEFRARFQFIDINAFMAQLGLSTFEELQERYHYLLTEIHLQPPPAFNPADPANQHRFTLGLAVFIRDLIDVTTVLREAKLAQVTMERALTFRQTVDVAEVRTPYAPLLVFPENALSGRPFTADALQGFFAREHILTLFVTPP